jgi:hypothetical protein
MSNTGLAIVNKFDTINQIILLSVIPLSGAHCRKIKLIMFTEVWFVTATVKEEKLWLIVKSLEIEKLKFKKN